MVDEIEFHIKTSYVQKIYDSCKDVVYTALSAPALALMCGSWGADLCTAKRLFTFMGSLDNGVSPFQINYKFYDTDEEDGTAAYQPYETVAKDCQEEISTGLGSCSCTDCQNACSVPDFDDDQVRKKAKLKNNLLSTYAM